MGAADGHVLGIAKILDHGPETERSNLVFVAEGYTEAERPLFEQHCADAMQALRNEPWFDTLLHAMNVHRIDVASDESGADNPTACGGSGAVVDTFFDASFCHNGLQRILTVDSDAVIAVVTERVPLWHGIIVLVNSPVFGGSGGEVVVAAVNGDWTNTLLHELGHTLFGLADEYSVSGGEDEPDVSEDQGSGAEPYQPNVTTARTRAALKWTHLVAPAIPVPTMENEDCSISDPRPSFLDDDHQIGLFEGARYTHCGLFRPAYACKMRNQSEFCRVCVEAIHEQLRPFFSLEPALGSEARTLEFGSFGLGLTRTLTFEISNIGAMDVTGVDITIDNANYAFTLSSAADVLAPGEGRCSS